MEDYGNRGVFQGPNTRPIRNGVVAFRTIWHRRRVFELVLDLKRRTLTFPVVLPGVAARSVLYREFRKFVASHHDRSLPAHRRIDPLKARLACANRRGNVSLTMKVQDGDFRYGAQRLLHLVHETFVCFLVAGTYRDYRVEQLGGDPDAE